MTNGTQQAIAEKLVSDYLTTFSLETYEGRVTTDEVVESVSMSLNSLGIIISNQAVYDAIRLLGPCGEADTKWLQRWGGGRIGWTSAMETELLVNGASIDEWGMIV